MGFCLVGGRELFYTYERVWQLIDGRFELGLGWFGGYDGYDLAALSLLSRGPPLYLLGTFYGVRATALTTTLLIDTLTAYIPFRLLRPISSAHMATKDHPSAAVPNREVVTDYTIQTITSLLAASIYSVTLYGAYQTYLPTHLVTYFEGITSITAAHRATPISLTPITLILGLACKSFIFTPVAALPKPKATHFDPSTATLSETFWYNVWGYKPRTKVILSRTLVLMLVSGVNTFIQTFVTIDGVEVCHSECFTPRETFKTCYSGLTVNHR